MNLGSDFFKQIGSKGGKKTAESENKAYGFQNPEIAKEAGKKSKRKKINVDSLSKRPTESDKYYEEIDKNVSN